MALFPFRGSIGGGTLKFTSWRVLLLNSVESTLAWVFGAPLVDLFWNVGMTRGEPSMLTLYLRACQHPLFLSGTLLWLMVAWWWCYHPGPPKHSFSLKPPLQNFSSNSPSIADHFWHPDSHTTLHVQNPLRIAKRKCPKYSAKVQSMKT